MSRRRKKTRLSGMEALQHAYEQIDTAPLFEELGVDIEDDLLRLALTHRSFANENGTLPNNERLEFLGDAVLGLIIAEALYDQYPSRPESDISKMRASVVSRYGCADVAREINLGAYLLLGRGELATGGRNKESILADATEALLGAVYRQYGFERTRTVVLRLFGEKISNAVATGHTIDSKTNLQERLAELNAPTADYITEVEGPDHQQVFTTQLYVGDIHLGTGVGPNKKHAEQAAAAQAVRVLREKPELAPRRA